MSDVKINLKYNSNIEELKKVEKKLKDIKNLTDSKSEIVDNKELKETKKIVKDTNKQVANITGNIEKMNKNMKESNSQSKKLKDNMALAAKSTGALALSMKMLRTYVNVIDDLRQLDQATYDLGIVAGKTSGQIELMRDALLDMGSQAPQTAIEIARAINLVERTGVTHRDAQQIVEAGMTLATASGEKLSDVSQILAKALVAFKLDGEAATHAIQSFHSAVLQTPLSLEKLKNAMNNSASAFASMLTFTSKSGKQLEEYKLQLLDLSAAMTGALVKAGNKSSTAGIVIRNFMTKLIASTETGQEAFNSLGLQVDGTMMTFSNFAEVAKNDVYEAMNILLDNTSALRANQDVLRKVFDTRQMTRIVAMLDLMKTSGSVETFVEEVTTGRDVFKDYTTQLENFNNQMAITKGKLDETSSAIFSMTKAVGSDVLPIINKILEGITFLNESLAGTVVQAGVAAGALSLVGGGLVGLVRSSTALTGAMSGATALFSGWTALIPIVITGLTSIYGIYKKIQKEAEDTRAQELQRKQDIYNINKSIQDSKILTESYANSIEVGVNTSLEEQLKSWKYITDEIDQAIKKSDIYGGIFKNLTTPQAPSLEAPSFSNMSSFTDLDRGMLKEDELRKQIKSLEEKIKNEQDLNSGSNFLQSDTRIYKYENDIKELEDELSRLESKRQKKDRETEQEKQKILEENNKEMSEWIEKTNLQMSDTEKWLSRLDQKLAKASYAEAEIENYSEWANEVEKFSPSLISFIEEYNSGLSKSEKLTTDLNTVTSDYFKNNKTDLVAMMQVSKMARESIKKDSKEINKLDEISGSRDLTKSEKALQKQYEKRVKFNEKLIKDMNKRINIVVENSNEAGKALKEAFSNIYNPRNFDEMERKLESMTLSPLKRLQEQKSIQEDIINSNSNAQKDWIKAQEELNKLTRGVEKRDGKFVFENASSEKVAALKAEYDIQVDIVEEREKEYEAYIKAQMALKELIKDTEEYKNNIENIQFEATLIGLNDEDRLEQKIQKSMRDLDVSSESSIMAAIVESDDIDRANELKNLLEMIYQQDEDNFSDRIASEKIYNSINKSQNKITNERVVSLRKKLSLKDDELLTEQEIVNLTDEQRKMYKELISYQEKLNQERQKGLNTLLDTVNSFTSGQSMSPSYNSNKMINLASGKNLTKKETNQGYIASANFLLTQYNNISKQINQQKSQAIDKEIQMLEDRKEIAKTEEERQKIEQSILDNKKTQIDIETGQRNQSSILGGIGQGTALGATLGGPIGAGIGAVIGGMAGVFQMQENNAQAEYQKKMLEYQKARTDIAEEQQKRQQQLDKYVSQSSEYGVGFAKRDTAFTSATGTGQDDWKRTQFSTWWKTWEKTETETAAYTVSGAESRKEFQENIKLAKEARAAQQTAINEYITGKKERASANAELEAMDNAIRTAENSLKDYNKELAKTTERWVGFKDISEKGEDENWVWAKRADILAASIESAKKGMIDFNEIASSSLSGSFVKNLVLGEGSEIDDELDSLEKKMQIFAGKIASGEDMNMSFEERDNLGLAPLKRGMSYNESNNIITSIVESMDRIKNQQKVINNQALTFTETMHSAGIEISDMSNDIRYGLYDGFQSMLDEDTFEGIFNSISGTISSPVSDAMKKGLINKKLDKSLITIQRKLSNYLQGDVFNISGIQGLVSEANKITAQTQTGANRLSAVMDMFKMDSDIQYTTQQEKISYQAGSTSDNTYYFTNNITTEIGNAVANEESMREFSDNIASYLQTSFRNIGINIT